MQILFPSLFLDVSGDFSMDLKTVIIFLCYSLLRSLPFWRFSLFIVFYCLFFLKKIYKHLILWYSLNLSWYKGKGMDLLGLRSSWNSHVFVHMKTDLVTNYLFKDVYIVIGLGRRDSLSLQVKGQIYLLSNNKDNVSLWVRFISSPLINWKVF